MGIRLLRSMAARAVVLIALCVACPAVADGRVDMEDPSDMADEFLSQMSYDKLDNQQSRGMMYATELAGLNAVEAAEDQHDQLGESDDSGLSSALAQCDGDQECREVVHSLLLGEAKEKKEEVQCADTAHPKICEAQETLCTHAEHGAKVASQCMKTCDACPKKGCQDKTSHCAAEKNKKYCDGPKMGTTVSGVCPKSCRKCF